MSNNAGFETTPDDTIGNIQKEVPAGEVVQDRFRKSELTKAAFHFVTSILDPEGRMDTDQSQEERRIAVDFFGKLGGVLVKKEIDVMEEK